MLMTRVGGTPDSALLAALARGQLRKKLSKLRPARTGRCKPHPRFMAGRLLADIDQVEAAGAELSRRSEELLAPFAQALEPRISLPAVQRRTAEVMVPKSAPTCAASPASRSFRARQIWVPAIMRAPVNPAAAKRAAVIAGSAPRSGQPAARQAAPSAPPLAHAILACAATSGGHGRALLAGGRSIREIAYHLLSPQTTYKELGLDDFDRLPTERLKRRRLAQLQRLRYQVTLTSFHCCLSRSIFQGSKESASCVQIPCRRPKKLAGILLLISLSNCVNLRIPLITGLRFQRILNKFSSLPMAQSMLAKGLGCRGGLRSCCFHPYRSFLSVLQSLLF